MKKIEDYSIINRISKMRTSEVYRCTREGDVNTYVIRVLRSSKLNASEVARFKHKYKLIKKIDLEGVVKPCKIIDLNNSIAIVLEDFNGIALKEIIREGPVSIDNFLKFGIQLAGTLGDLHAANIVHRDIKPGNILTNRETGMVKITDFGIAAELTRDYKTIYDPNTIQGKLAYLSPEQTGRINKRADYRTDYYSLGVTFYEMLAGKNPFIKDDPLEVIHAHIATQPEPPHRYNRSIPEAVSAIVMKLMSKIPDDRYQSGFGLKADLEKCLCQLKEKNRVDPFELGAKDISIKFTIPQRLFGRENEIDILVNTLNRVAAGSIEMVFVTGSAGIGKSSLINEIKTYVEEIKGFYITGKYEQFKGSSPYNAVIQAFQGLIRKVLCQSQEMIDTWKKKLTEALGKNGKIITNIIPELELIIGPQPDIQELGPEESQNRFQHFFKCFASEFATQDHPLVLFLDDMQWIDVASIGFLNSILSDAKGRYIYIIGAYRDEEIDQKHILKSFINGLNNKGVEMIVLSLPPLSVANVNSILVNLLRRDEDDLIPLAELVHLKTGGNPFFVNHFLTALYDEGVLALKPEIGWAWDIDEVKAARITDNVIDLMVKSILSLPEKSIEIMKTCACIGNWFDLGTVAMLSGRSIDKALSDLAFALEAGFIYYDKNSYIFQHDRVHEAVYSLLSDEEKKRLHYRIGKLALDNVDGKQLNERLFCIVKHLNIGSELIINQKERIRLIELNLLAGLKAKSSNAYNSAVEFLSTGITFLPEDSWQNYYELTYRLYRENGECLYLNTNFTEAERLFDGVFKNARRKREKIDVYYIKSILYTNQSHHKKSIESGLKGLRILGLKIPANPNKLAIACEIVKAKIKLHNKKMEDLLNAPDITDDRIISIFKLIIGMIASAFFHNTELYLLLGLKMLNLTLKYGSSNYASLAYVIYGMITGAGMGDHKTGYAFGSLAMNLADRYDDQNMKSVTYELFSGFVNGWTRPVKTNLELIKQAFQYCIESGNHFYGGGALVNDVINREFMGNNLDELDDIIENHIEINTKFKNQIFIDTFLFMADIIRSYRGSSRAFTRFSEKFEFTEIARQPIGSCHYYLLKQRECLIFGDVQSALDYAIKAEPLLESIKVLLIYVDYYFNHALTILNLLPDSSRKEKRRFKSTLKNHIKKLKKWMDHNPTNFEHKYLLVKAEEARLQGASNVASQFYGDAVRSARQNGFTQNEALANELAAKYYISEGNKDIALHYMKRALYCYTKWGADTKALKLKKQWKNHNFTGRKEKIKDTSDTLS